MGIGGRQSILTVADYLELFEHGAQHLSSMAEKLTACWSPNESDPRKLHNIYVLNLVTCCVAKFAELSRSMIDAVEKQDFLTYALFGHSLMENAATLRYCVKNKYAPLFAEKAIDMEKLPEIDDMHLRGGRFDWEAFFRLDYSKLLLERQKTNSAGSGKGKGGSMGAQQGNPEAVNVKTCIERWSADTPEVMVIYAGPRGPIGSW